MSRLFFGILVLVCTSLSASVFGQQVQWVHDFEAAHEQAVNEEKLILMHFSAEWCRPCKELEKFVFTDASVARSIGEKLVPLHVDTDENPALVKKFSIKEIPTDVVVTTSGRVISQRKSPRDSSNYIRMVKSLPIASVANENKENAVTERLAKILGSKKELVPPDEKDFGAKAPSHEHPRASTASMRLEEQSRGSVAKQVDHESNSFAPQTVINKQSARGPQRVINDKFFVEKSAAASQQLATAAKSVSSMAEQAQFQPRKTAPQQIANATIKQSFPAPVKTQFGKAEESAARILTPDLRSAQQQMMAATAAAAASQSAIKQEMSKAEFVQQTKTVEQTPVAQPAPPQPTMASRGSTTKPQSTSNGLLQKMTKNAESKISGSADSMAVGVATTKTKTITPEFALGGRCPVTLLSEGKWMKGDSKYGCVHRGRVYIFGNEAKLKKFQTAPDDYSPVLAGYDPVKFHNSGSLVEGNEQHGVFMGEAPTQKIVLFSSQETRDKFQADPQKYMSTIQTAVKNSGRKIR